MIRAILMAVQAHILKALLFEPKPKRIVKPWLIFSPLFNYEFSFQTFTRQIMMDESIKMCKRSKTIIEELKNYSSKHHNYSNKTVITTIVNISNSWVMNDVQNLNSIIKRFMIHSLMVDK